MVRGASCLPEDLLATYCRVNAGLGQQLQRCKSRARSRSVQSRVTGLTAKRPFPPSSPEQKLRLRLDTSRKQQQSINSWNRTLLNAAKAKPYAFGRSKVASKHLPGSVQASASQPQAKDVVVNEGHVSESSNVKILTTTICVETGPGIGLHDVTSSLNQVLEVLSTLLPHAHWELIPRCGAASLQGLRMAA
eukprot:scaffold1190_cov393-Prasinococcus_capsulatus_cf.AAC.32